MRSSTLKLLSVVFAIALLSACGSRVRLNEEVKPSVQTQPAATQAGSNATQSNAVTTPTQTAGNTAKPSDSAKTALPGAPTESVYFDYDSSVVAEQFADLLTGYANFLKSTNGSKVVLEGHTDERGDSEYNLALGARRAEAVRAGLNTLGVATSQMSTVSFGKEKPRAQGSDEAAWAQNRRVDFNLSK